MSKGPENEVAGCVAINSASPLRQSSEQKLHKGVKIPGLRGINRSRNGPEERYWVKDTGHGEEQSCALGGVGGSKGGGGAVPPLPQCDPEFL